MDVTDNAKNLINEIEVISKDVCIVAASKMQNISEMNLAMFGGITVFGENKVQEFIEKYGKIDCKWHFIGHLQTNKVKYVVGKVDLIHSVESIKLVDEIDKLARKLDIVQKILIEINIGREESKHGVLPENFDDIYSYSKTKSNVLVVGIMSVMPKCADEELYLQLKEIYDRMKKEDDNISVLSCGMSNDYITAVRCGANMVRIGTKIFGNRDYSKET